MEFLSIILVLTSVVIGGTLKRKLSYYGRTPLESGLTGAEVAQRMLQQRGLSHVRVTCVSGHLTDHYNPLTHTVNLSKEIYCGSNAASAAVAAHECGHAVQHAEGYAFLQLRSAMVPLLTISTSLMPWVILLGIMLVRTTILPLAIAVVLFAFTTLFSLITLPVEFDASKRALYWMSHEGIVNHREYNIAKDALQWAAMTYVVAALGSLAELVKLLRWVDRSRR